jgi:hypothetical protein
LRFGASLVEDVRAARTTCHSLLNPQPSAST